MFKRKLPLYLQKIKDRRAADSKASGSSLAMGSSKYKERVMDLKDLNEFEQEDANLGESDGKPRARSIEEIKEAARKRRAMIEAEEARERAREEREHRIIQEMLDRYDPPEPPETPTQRRMRMRLEDYPGFLRGDYDLTPEEMADLNRKNEESRKNLPKKEGPGIFDIMRAQLEVKPNPLLMNNPLIFPEKAKKKDDNEPEF
ncbi:hypothetical protein [Mogibacterium diversum]|uniref:hypothetical protein n=1 Tax=Mogibacterium diversum TaxID=114527 RepID=UPI0028D4FAB9|nr:hypothetical protein [Mogibacterium diversum]